MNNLKNKFYTKDLIIRRILVFSYTLLKKLYIIIKMQVTAEQQVYIRNSHTPPQKSYTCAANTPPNDKPVKK